MLSQDAARDALLKLSEEMMQGGATLIQRVLPQSPDRFTQWEHYPKGDAIDPASKARWYYHAHPPEQRGPREHGHFHLFLPLTAFDGLEPLAVPVAKNMSPNNSGPNNLRPTNSEPSNSEKEDAAKKGAKVVHVGALAFDIDGLPTSWIATNQWVTQDYLFPAAAIIERLDHMEMSQAGEKHGLADIGRWLTLAMRACRPDLIALLEERDVASAKTTPQNRDVEILASCPFSL